MASARKPSSLRAGLIGLLSVSLIATGCTTMRPVFVDHSSAPAKHPDVKVGDRVVITLRSGDVKHFRVKAVDTDALYGNGVTVPYGDIELLEKRAPSHERTWILLGSVVAVVGGALALFIHLVAKESD